MPSWESSTPHASIVQRFSQMVACSVDREPTVGRAQKRRARISSRLQESITRNAEQTQERAVFAPFHRLGI